MSFHFAWTDEEVRLGVGGGAAWCLLRHITTLEKEVSALQARVEAHGRMTQEVMTNMARKQAQVARNQVALLDALRALPWANSRCCSSDDGGAARSSDESNLGDAAAASSSNEEPDPDGGVGSAGSASSSDSVASHEQDRQSKRFRSAPDSHSDDGFAALMNSVDEMFADC